MTINNPESYRTLTFEGVGTQFEIKRFTYLNRFRNGELLERDEWEYEYDEEWIKRMKKLLKELMTVN